nr:acyltransferase [Citrobacter freundii]
MNNRRIIFLDYMRVVAFTLVVIGHQFNKDLYKMAADTSNHITLRTLYSILADATIGGAMGVIIFFLVSGYIITHVLQTEKTIEFYLKRIFRIYPLYIFAVLCELLLQHFNGIPIPTLSIIIPRLLLIGDFFDTPLALGEVEWTLRVEVLFYIFMGLLRTLGIISKGNIIAVILLATTFMLFVSTPFPISTNFHNAYLSIYLPFLFIGVIIYYIEKKMVNYSIAIICVLALFYMHLVMIDKFSPSWGRFNYAFTGTIIFISSWALRNHFQYTKPCSFLSELTYAIYLFHKWVWDSLSEIVSNLNITFVNSNVQIIALLIGICFASHKLIENKGVQLGKRISKMYLTKSIKV